MLPIKSPTPAPELSKRPRLLGVLIVPWALATARLTLLHHLLLYVRPLNWPSLNLTTHQKKHRKTQIPRARPEMTALLSLRRSQGACMSSSSQRFSTLQARSAPKDGMKKPASCGLREAGDQHLDHPGAQQ